MTNMLEQKYGEKLRYKEKIVNNGYIGKTILLQICLIYQGVKNMRVNPIFLFTAILVFLTTIMAFAQAAPERRWDLKLDGFFQNGKNPLSIYARERGNQWISAVGSSIIPGTAKFALNKSYHYADLTKIPITDGKVKGPVTVYLTPDLWVPRNHLGIKIELTVDAVITADGKLDGTYTVDKVISDDPQAKTFGKGGKITGVSKPYTPAALPDPITLNLNLQGSLVGGKPDFIERCQVVRLGIKNNAVASGINGLLSQKDAVFNANGFAIADNAVTCNADGFKGTFSFPSKTADEVDCTCTFEVNGFFMEGFQVGSYKETVTVAGADPIIVTGSFDGRWNAGIETLPIGGDPRPWWSPVKDFKPVQANEHPRLLFRKADVPALRERAKTPEGQAIIARLKKQLGGGEAMPTSWSKSTSAYQGASPNLPLGAYTIGHAAGFGFLYQLTGEQKYADLAKESFEWGLKGIRDADDRYSWVKSGGALRAGTLIGWYALAYDLAYDGWDDATRQKFALALSTYDDGLATRDDKSEVSLKRLTYGVHAPGSNHFGMQVGGAAIALLAVTGDAGVADQKEIDKLLLVSEKSMVRNLSEGFGDGGMFAEGDGCGSMSSNIVFLPTLQSWRNSKGMDYANVERPNARMMTLKWIYLTSFSTARPDFWPIRGEYGHNVWSREGMSGTGYFAEGFGVMPEEQKAGMLWYYNHFMASNDTNAGIPFDTASKYPQYTICAFVNWPLNLKEKNPAEVLPLCYRDTKYDFYAWRNRWKDGNDTIISVLMKTTTGGNYKASIDLTLKVNAGGNKFPWVKISGDTRYWWMSPKGETSVLTAADGTTLGVDFTLASGADVLLVTTGTADGTPMKLGDKTLTLKFIGGVAPTPAVDGDKITVGKQTISLKDGNIVFGVQAK